VQVEALNFIRRHKAPLAQMEGFLLRDEHVVVGSTRFRSRLYMEFIRFMILLRSPRNDIFAH